MKLTTNMRLITVLAACLMLTALAPLNEVKQPGAGHIGLGAIKCSVVIEGFSVSKSSEMRQWLFGFMAAVDDDVFALSQQDIATRETVEGQIAIKLRKFIESYCNVHGDKTIGDGMVDLKRSYDFDAWQNILKAFDKPKFEQ